MYAIIVRGGEEGERGMLCMGEGGGMHKRL